MVAVQQRAIDLLLRLAARLTVPLAEMQQRLFDKTGVSISRSRLWVCWPCGIKKIGSLLLLEAYEAGRGSLQELVRQFGVS